MKKLLCRLAFLSFLISTVSIQAQETTPSDSVVVHIGDAAPVFQAKADNGKVWKSSDHVGKGTLVVYFFPAALTGG